MPAYETSTLSELRSLIAQARLSAGLSLEAISRQLIEVSPEVLQAFEDGRGSLRSDALFGIVNLLNLDPFTVQDILDRMGIASQTADTDEDLDFLNFLKQL